MSTHRPDRDHYLLCYIAEHEMVRGKTPTPSQMRDTFGFKSRTSIDRIIDRLVRDGKLRRHKRKLEILTHEYSLR